MNQLNKNYIKYVSILDTLYTNDIRKNIYLKNIYIIKKKKINTTKIISTCIVRGRIKKTYKKNHVSRHFIRDEMHKNILTQWSIETW